MRLIYLLALVLVVGCGSGSDFVVKGKNVTIEGTMKDGATAEPSEAKGALQLAVTRVESK